MSTLRTTVLVVFGGVVLASMVAILLRSQSPQGFLFYTPAPGVPANYTPASAVGFSLTMLALLCLSLVAAGAAGVLVWLERKAWLTVAKVALFSSIAFGLLLLFTAFTEQQWP